MKFTDLGLLLNKILTIIHPNRTLINIETSRKIHPIVKILRNRQRDLYKAPKEKKISWKKPTNDEHSKF